MISLFIFGKIKIVHKNSKLFASLHQVDDSETCTDNVLFSDDFNRVVIIAAIMQEIRKTPAMKKMSDLYAVFIRKIE